MSMYQLILVLSLAAVLHAQCMEWDINHSENYNFNPVDANAARAWVCERYGITKPADIEGTASKIPDAKYCFKIGTGNQELWSWFDPLNPNNYIRTKFCGLLDFQCFAEALAKGSALLTTKLIAFLSIIINITIGVIPIPSQGFSSDVSKIPSNVGCIFGMSNAKDSFIDNLWRKGLINQKVWTIDLQSTGLTPGKVTLGTRNLGVNDFEVPVFNGMPWSFEVKSISIDDYVFPYTSYITRFDLTYNYISFADLNLFEKCMNEISAVKGADGNYHVDCATASNLKNLVLTMGNNNLYKIKMEKLIKKSGNDCICLVQYTPGVNVLGMPAFEDRRTSYDFSNATLAYTNPV